jgi:two-component system sensor histidine kinase HydH
MESLLEAPPTNAQESGLLLAAIDVESGASLLPLPFDLSILATGEEITWGGSRWLVARRELSEPPVRLIALAPLTPVVAPLEAAARRGLWLLLGVSSLAFALAGLLTRRLTRSLEQLADAAAGISRGDLDLQVDLAGDDEVGRLGSAFNRMTENLRSTLRKLSRREALSTVGELAASLSHEVRNILTSVRLDLQRVEETLPEGGPARETQRRALSEIARLDATVTSTLQMARGSRFEPTPVMLAEPLEAARHAAMPEFRARRATLDMPSIEKTVLVEGESDALEQLFLNLLLNAAQALDEGGRAEVRFAQADDRVAVSIIDRGEGLSEEQQEKIFEPFYSTRPEGTGLGLPVVQRIVRLHRGRIEVESTPRKGTTVRVELPVVAGEPGAPR